MSRRASYLGSALVALALLTSKALASTCEVPTSPPADGYEWFYVRLVTPAPTAQDQNVRVGVKMLLTTKSWVGEAPPDDNIAFNKADATPTCFVKAVSRNTRAVKVRAKAVGYVNKVCDVGETWRRHNEADPFECEVLPERQGVASIGGYVRLADLDPSLRAAALQGMIDAALDVDEPLRVAAIEQLGATFDVRTGVLAQAVLARTSTRCPRSHCIPVLDDPDTQWAHRWLTESTAAIAAEEQRDEKTDTIRAEHMLPPQLRNDVLLILNDPSKRAAYGVGLPAVGLSSYVDAQLPKDRAFYVKKIVAANFDVANAMKQMDLAPWAPPGPTP